MTERRDGSPRTSRWRWALPLLVVLAWLAAGAITGPFAGQLSEVQSNDNASFLPTDAESTRVAALQQRFQQADDVPAVVVWEADGTVTPALRAAAEQALAEAAGLDGVAGAPTPLQASPDGQALQAVVPLAPELGEDLVSVVASLREVVGDPPDGAAYVTGPAGIFGDFAEAFAAIDGLLLLVALAVVLVILLVVYRSPVLPLLVILTSVLALAAASAAVYGLTSADLLTLNGQSQGIMFILVVGAATDYALLLVARVREELHSEPSRFRAVGTALRRSAEPVAASGGTVVLGVLCLLASELESNASLGPVAALGVAFSVLAVLTFLPAVLALLGRAAYWPFQPRVDDVDVGDRGGVWSRVADLVGRRARAVWLVTFVALALAAAFLPTFDAGGVSQADAFLTEVESVTGQEALARHFPGGSGSPAVVVAQADRLDQVVTTVQADDGVAAAAPSSGGPPGQGGSPVVVDGLVQVQAVLTDTADSEAALQTVQRLRGALDSVDGAEARVGGPSAVALDVREASSRDLRVIIPLVLLVILVVLALLLRSLLAPVLLVGTVVLSFAATLGVGALVFEHVFGFPGSDPAIPLYAFVFLGALGIDYNIFLMTRVREESRRSGTRSGVLTGLAVTGGVITSAGVVLAATFGALLVLPVLFLAQIAFLVAFGVLLDTLVVRALLVPALVRDIGPRVWWPSRLSRTR